MVEIGSRRRNQPAPPRALFEALTDPDRDPGRSWLHLLEDEQRPTVLATEPPSSVIWSSLWSRRPDAVIRFELPDDLAGQGTDLRWILTTDEPVPDISLTGHLRKRMNQLINANLRFTFGH